MNRTSFAALAWILTVAASAAAEPPAAPPAAIPLSKGDSVAFELKALPDSFDGEGKAVCVGTRIVATGPAEARCLRPFRFTVPADAARMVYTFRAKEGGREVRIELPVTRAAKPVIFVAPSAGSLLSPPPTPFPEEVADRAARKAAAEQCGGCAGEGFALESFEVTKPPLPPGGALPVRIAVTSTVPAAPPPAER